MAITALPEATVHLLGSAQALTTPTSLVKELIDNGLDAKATAIDILISQNTLDKVEVRDNGHGIAQDDLDALGRRGHTSKLRSFDELKAIGGTSLGFRGEALASAVQLGEVSVTSRTEGDAVATMVKLKAPGGVDTQSRKSHPIGTTVCVLKFLEKIPVRKQTALKVAAKTLGKIRELLQAYALARPAVRFSLKITKGTKGSWSFVPKPNGGIKEAVSQAIGRDVAAQCMEKSIAFSESQLDESLPEEHRLLEDQFLVEAFLPTPDADLSKIKHGQFVSIDSRPVSHEKGTMKRIITIFKHCLKSTFGNDAEIKNPFIRLNITCPVASYDPNVEPAKDDVLFGNEYLVLEKIEDLFKSVYSEHRSTPAVKAPHSFSPKLDDFELLLARKPEKPTGNVLESPHDSEPSPEDRPASTASPSPMASDTTRAEEHIESTIEGDEGQPVEGRRKWGFDMSKDFTEDTGGLARSNRPKRFRSPGPTQKPPSVPPNSSDSLNPWLIAKMTAPVQRNNDIVHPTPSLVSAPESSSVSQQHPRQSSEPLLLDPDYQEMINFPAPPRRRYSNESLNPLHMTLASPPDVHHDQPRRRYSNEDMRYGRPSLAAGHDEVFEVQTPQARRRNDFVSARHLPENAFISPPATTIQRPRGTKKASNVNKPFVPPRISAGLTTVSDGFRQTTINGYQAHIGTEGARLQMEPGEELEWAMDYEQRKEDATRHHREERRKRRADALLRDPDQVPRSSPHQNRYNSAVKALEAEKASHENVPIIEPLKTTLKDGDPRVYLMKQQRLMAVSNGGPLKLSRAKSMKLPLERIPDNHQTHNLLVSLSTSSERIKNIMNDTTKDDMYVNRGSHPAGLSIDSSASAALISKIQAVVEKWMDMEEERRCEVEYDFEKFLKGAMFCSE